MSEERARKTPYGLIISVALNGLLVGLLAGVLLSGGPRGRGGPPPLGPVDGGERAMARAILKSAPQEARLQIRRNMEDAWKNTEAERRLIREAQATISNAVSAETFDRDAVEAAFETWRAADLRIKEAVQQAMISTLEGMPAESRKALAEQMKFREERRERFRERMRERREERLERRGD